MGFKKDFVWGAATAAYQIEGAANADGRGLSVWDVFSQTPEKVFEGHTGDVACDHYNRYKEDAALIKATGARAYRFSTCWPRVLPDGIGKVNQRGLDFYDRLVDELLSNGIEPYITLFHWDFPYELYKKGGWLNRDSADWFAEYTKVIVEKLSDRVKNWFTQNEPECYIVLGHERGYHAPGLKLPLNEVLLAAHNSMRAHGKSVMAIRSYSKQKANIGYAPNGSLFMPATESKEDIEAARKATFEVSSDRRWKPSLFTDPVILGDYPSSAYNVYGKEMPKIDAGDLETMCQPLDFLGFNIYLGEYVKSGENGEAIEVEKVAGRLETSMGWPVSPEVMYWSPKFLLERYKLPLCITENGMANNDWVSVNGKVQDHQRIDFLRRYIAQYKRLADEGADLMGYFHWSLMDNFEWAYGYSKRFGLIHVDYQTQKRTIKESGYWYKHVIETNGEEL